MTDTSYIAGIAGTFAVSGVPVQVEPHGGGHIHGSYRVTFQAGPVRARYLLQRINTGVFPDPAAVMDNVVRVTQHVRDRLTRQGAADLDRRVLTPVPARAGGYLVSQDGAWRTYRYVEGTCVHESARTAEHAYTAGYAYGAFQEMLADLPGPPLHETIPHFHDTPRRVAALEEAVRADPLRRTVEAGEQIGFALARRPLGDVLLSLSRGGAAPLRVVHNDAKMSNLLLDVVTGEALCVTDLDTVMPGLSLYDFGDMMRTMTCPAAEDEQDHSRVAVRPELFEALARGYLEAARFLTPAERKHLVAAGMVITYEQGVRFLTDHLLGDVYYGAARPGHNLQRARTQFALLASMERTQQSLRRLAQEG